VAAWETSPVTSCRLQVWDRAQAGGALSYAVWCTVLRCAVLCGALCCAALCCAVLCCAVLCCAVLCCAVLCCAVLCCAALCCAVVSDVPFWTWAWVMRAPASQGRTPTAAPTPRGPPSNCR
jgi:hypothetical protein